MTYPRFVFGIMQCVLALLLLVGGPSQTHPSYGSTILVLAASADLVVSDAQPHKGAIKREAEQNLGLKRTHWPSPKALVPAQSEGPAPTSFVEAGHCTPSALHVSLHRPCAAPPTGPPSSR
jgi:hypothetical protein